MGEAYGTPKHQQAMSRQAMHQIYPNLDVEVSDDESDDDRNCFCDELADAGQYECESRELISSSVRYRPFPTVVGGRCTKCGAKRKIEKAAAASTVSTLVTSSQPCSKSGSNSSKNKWLIILGVVCLVVAVGCSTCWWSLMPWTGTKVALLDIEKVAEAFEADLVGIKERFAKQSKATWASIRAAVRMTTKERQPQSPGVISLIPSVEDPTADDTVRCLAKKLAQTLQRSYNDSRLLEIDGERIGLSGGGRRSMQMQLDDDDVAVKLDEEIRHSLQNNADHVVLISNFDRLPAKSGMLFHGLCDTNNAPFKQAIYILTVASRQSTDVVNVVDAEVTIAWKTELAEEQRQSLETRIGNNIAVILPEPRYTLEQVC